MTRPVFKAGFFWLRAILPGTLLGFLLVEICLPAGGPVLRAFLILLPSLAGFLIAGLIKAKRSQQKDFLGSNNQTLTERLKQENRTREAMLAITQSIMEVEELDKFFDLILEKAIEANHKAEMGSVMLLDKKNVLFFSAVKGYNFEYLKKITVPLENSFLYVATQGKITGAKVINNIYEFNQKHFSQEAVDFLTEGEADQIGSTLCAPIMVDQELRGLLCLDNKKPNAFKESDIDILDYFTAQIGIAIKNHELLQKTIYLSRYDRRTDTLNRSWFEDCVKKRCPAAKLDPEQGFTLALFDLDNLKDVNDRYGHHAGDQLIVTFAKTIRSGLLENEPLARYGGDEFIAVLETTKPEEALERLEKIKQSFADTPIWVDEKSSVNGSFSFGIASCPAESSNYEALVKIADEKMYRYKSARKSSG